MTVKFESYRPPAALPIRQRDLSRCPDRQGHRRPTDLGGAVATLAAVLLKIPCRSAGQRRASRQSASSSSIWHPDQIWPLSSRRFDHHPGECHGAAGRRPMLDQTSALVDSIPTQKISPLLDESHKALGGADTTWDRCSTRRPPHSRCRRCGPADAHPDRRQPAAARRSGAIRRRHPHLVAQPGRGDRQVAADDQQWRTILRDGPGAADERPGCSTR